MDECKYRDGDKMYLDRQEVMLVLVVVGHQREVNSDKEGRVHP